MVILLSNSTDLIVIVKNSVIGGVHVGMPLDPKLPIFVRKTKNRVIENKRTDN